MLEKKMGRQMQALAIFPKLLWGAMFSSVGVLTAVTFLLSQGQKPGTIASSATAKLAEPIAESFTAPFSVAAAVLALIVLWLRSRLVSGRGLGPPQQSSVVASSADEAEQVRRRAAHLLPLLIIACALSEAIAVLGFIVAYATKDPGQIVPFAAASTVLFLSLFPSIPRWAGASRE